MEKKNKAAVKVEAKGDKAPKKAAKEAATTKKEAKPVSMPPKAKKAAEAPKKAEKAAKGKKAKAKDEEDEDVNEDLPEDEEDELIKSLETIKKNFVKKGKAAGYINQEDVMEATSKLDLSEEEENVEEAPASETEILNAQKEVEEDAADDDSADDEEKEELANIDEFSKIQSGDVKVNDSVKMYLKEIGKVNLLTAKQETELAKRIANMDKAQKALKDAQAKGDVKAIAEATYEVNDAQDAKNQLITANLRLVISIAKHYVGRGMHFLDLIQEGNMGLIKAVEKFDYTKGFKFSTYATWWIRQAITRAIADQARTIRIPVHMVETINRLMRTSRHLLQTLGREPTPEEIASEMEIPVEKVREILKISQDPISLETPVGEEDDSSVGNFIPDEEAPSPSEQAADVLLKEQIEEVMDTLTPREARVLKLRFGLEDGRPRTLEEVGREFMVTRERIRQIEAKALRKLRHPSRSKKLKDFMSTDK